MDERKILIAGIGNIFLGDDAFGVEVVRRLARRPLPPCVRVVDFGIRGLDLVYALLDGPDVAILVDAAPRGGEPGTLYVIEPELPAPAEAAADAMLDTHSLDPVKVLRLVAALGGHVRRLLLVACEPERTGDLAEMQDGLSESVQAAVDEAIPLIEGLVTKLLLEADAAVPGPVETH